MYMPNVIVVGSGPGACAATLRLVNSGYHVTMLERGRPMPSAVMGTTGNVLNGIMRINRNDQPIVLGGGSAVNYGVYVLPPADELSEMFGPLMPSDDMLSKFHDLFSSRIANELGSTRFTTQASSRVAAMMGVCDQHPRRDASVASGVPWTSYGVGATWIRSGTIADTKVDTRLSPLTLIESHPNVTIFPNVYVTRVERRGTKWCAVAHCGSMFEADQLLLCAGAIGTAEIILRSNLPRGVHNSVGDTLHDHRRVSVIACYRCLNQMSTTRPLVNNIVVSAPPSRAHVEVVLQPGLDGVTNVCSTAFGVCASTSSIASCLPSWCTISPTLATESFDPWCCCGPCAATCNPCRYVNVVAFVVGMRADRPGCVRVDAIGNTRVHPAQLGDESRERLQVLADNIATNIREDPQTCCVMGADAGRADTEWHHAGTVPYGRATDATGQLLDVGGRSYDGLYIADISLLLKLPTLNTQAAAALGGWLVASKLLDGSSNRRHDPLMCSVIERL